MTDTREVDFLRGSELSGTATATHPIIELSDEELKAVLGGVDATMVTHSTMTGSYNDSTLACCDGTKVCCN